MRSGDVSCVELEISQMLSTKVRRHVVTTAIS